jgi:transcription termination factor Rho
MPVKKKAAPQLDAIIGQPPTEEGTTQVTPPKTATSTEVPSTVSSTEAPVVVESVPLTETVVKEAVATTPMTEISPEIALPQTESSLETTSKVDVSSNGAAAGLTAKAVPVTPLRPKTPIAPIITRSSRPAPVLGTLSKGLIKPPVRPAAEPDRPPVMVKGILDMSRDGHGVLRATYAQDDRDAYISTSQVRRFNLRQGDVVEGPGREPKENERYWGLLKVDTVNGRPVAEIMNAKRVKFQSLTPVYPDTPIKLEIGDEPLSLRIIDLIAPIGKGQRSLIVSPPKAGKTTLLKDVATGIAANHPEIHLMAVLVGERPEEVTDITRHIAKLTKNQGEVAASNFDEPAQDQCRVAELALDRAKRLVEEGRDVVILLDSITRLARAYNLAIPTSGRTLSGGFDPAALFPPKKFFGAARNFEVPGSLTIIGTALVDTGSRMDDLVYEEFKGTGNQEVHLSRKLAERRVYPAIEVQKSSTRRDDLLMDSMTYQSVTTLHRMLDMLDREERSSTLIEQMKRTKTNKEFLASIKAS